MTALAAVALLLVAFGAFLIWQAHPLDRARQRAREAAAADAHVAEYRRGRRRYDVSDVFGRPE